jgi:hypothetical protein
MRKLLRLRDRADTKNKRFPSTEEMQREDRKR